MASSDNNTAVEQQQHYAYAGHLVTLSVLPMTLQAVFELGVFEILAKAGDGANLSPAEIAAEITTTNPNAALMLDRMLRLLACHSVVGCSIASDKDGNVQRLYSLTPISKYYVRNEDGVSLGPMLSLIQDKVFLQSWFALLDFFMLFNIYFFLLIEGKLVGIAKIKYKWRYVILVRNYVSTAMFEKLET